MRLDEDLRERAERVAREQKRTLTSLLTYALELEVSALEARAIRQKRTRESAAA
jgi:predicted transcriptional regulator